MKAVLISDIHFGEFSRTEELAVPGFSIQDDNSGAEPLLDGLISIINEEEAKYIFIAGDLTSIASPLEFYYFEKMITVLSEKTRIPVNQIICITGNHDNDWRIHSISDSIIAEYGESLDSQLKSQLREKYDNLASNSAVTNLQSLTKGLNGIAPFSGIIDNEDFILFALNSGWRCMPDQKYSHGLLSQEQLAWFKAQLEQFELDTRTKIVMLHHHPKKYSYPVPSEDVSLLEESSELLDLAGRYGVNLILHGHRHHPRAETIHESNWANPISFICAGSLSVNAKHRSNGEIPNTAHIIDFEYAPEKFLLKNYEYSASTGWGPIKNYRPEVPLDAEEWHGRVYLESEYETAIKNYYKTLTNPVTILKYNDLPDCLHFVRYDRLNELFRNNVPDTLLFSGSFPSDVPVITKETIKT